MVRCNVPPLSRRALLASILLASLGAADGGKTAYADGARHHGARLHNPFCAVPTFVRRYLDTQGQALIEPGGRAVIFIGREEASGSRPYRDFLMAHECCHHSRGHLLRLKEKGRERALLSMSFVNRSVELDADCCAGIALAKAGRFGAIREAARRMRAFGAMPTGADVYPAGDLRATLIEECALSGRNVSFPEALDPTLHGLGKR
jgi:hypothetical protein